MAVAKKPVAKKTVAAKKTTTARTTKPKSDAPRPEIHAKQVSLIISVGTEDRDRDFEKFVEDVIKAIQTSKTANVKRVVQGGGHYILDGKVCLPADYDPTTQNFLPGKTPPPWAGGPAPKNIVEKTDPQTEARRYLPREEAERRIAAGRAKNAKPADDDEFEDFTEWEAEDANDHTALEKVAEESIKATTTKKRVIKKSASPKPAPAPAKKPAPRRRKSV